jgi:hypothetical protein
MWPECREQDVNVGARVSCVPAWAWCHRPVRRGWRGRRPLAGPSIPVTPERSTLIGCSPAIACIRRQWDSNSSTHGPASRPWRRRTISDVDSIVSIFNMASVQRSATCSLPPSVHNACQAGLSKNGGHGGRPAGYGPPISDPSEGLDGSLKRRNLPCAIGVKRWHHRKPLWPPSRLSR